MSSNPFSAASSVYRQVSFEAAPPLKIVHMMYEGALRFLGHAADIDPIRDCRAFSEKLRRASDVISELRLALEPSHSQDLCDKLTSLYLFVERRIQDALLERRVEPLADARLVLGTLLDGWKRVGLELEKGA